MPAKMNMKSVKDRLKDDTLDLSYCDLQEVPVREIAAVRKAAHLNLSDNLLIKLPSTFVTLKQIIRLDLSRNNLVEIPENIGEMKQLKHLDLYGNQISRLPLSMGELKNLKWLDLKENPLTPAVAGVAGPCSNMGECQACARNIVVYLSNVKLTIDEEKLKRLNSTNTTAESDNALSKKENQKKKKKADKENKKNVNKNESKAVLDKLLQSKDSKTSGTCSNKNASGGTSRHKASKSRRGICYQMTSIAVWMLFYLLALFLMFALLPKYFVEQSKELFNYVEDHTGVPVSTFHKQSADALNVSVQMATEYGNVIYNTVLETYEKHFK